MLKELFESCFYTTFPAKSGEVINLREIVYNGDFSLLDPEACRDCHYVCNLQLENREQLRIQSATCIHSIKIDDIFKPISEKLGEMCDYMLDDGCKLALIEMTCATKEYVGSKREKCIGQLFNTLTNLRTCGPISQHIDRSSGREAIFSWKETIAPKDLEDLVEISMTAMTELGDDIYSPDNVVSFESGFRYREIRYPDALIW